jgi:hypothetical protein
LHTKHHQYHFQQERALDNSHVSIKKFQSPEYEDLISKQKTEPLLNIMGLLQICIPQAIHILPYMNPV